MSKKNDDSIERIFRQAVTQYDPSFEKRDWLKMEELLDEEVRRSAALRSKRIKGTAYTLTGLMGLFIAVYFLAFNEPSDSVARVNPSAEEMQATREGLGNKGNVSTETPSAGLLSSETQASASVETLKDETNAPDASPFKTSDKNNSKTTQRYNQSLITDSNATTNEEKEHVSSNVLDKPTPSENQISFKKKTHLAITPDKTEKAEDLLVVAEHKDSKQDDTTQDQNNEANSFPRQSSASSGNMVLEENGQTRNHSSDLIGEESTISNALEKSSDENRIALNDLNLVKASSPTTDTLLNSNEQNTRIDSIKADAELDSQKKQKEKPSSRWSAGIVLAPEFSTTRLNHYSSPGESVGLRIGYQISSRFNINTGILRSTKKYKDNGAEYKPNKGYWKNRTNGVVPEEIDSKCLVVEIPLDIQFDVVQTQKSRVFLSAAMSSYFMLRQEYQYDFESPNPGAVSGWETSKSESYLFGVGMISAGYERNINRSLAVGVEPYLKFSLKELGWPNMKLFSTGAYITLRYKFMTSRK